MRLVLTILLIIACFNTSMWLLPLVPFLYWRELVVMAVLGRFLYNEDH